MENKMNSRSEFEYYEHDFRPIYDTIKKYFPIDTSVTYNHENIKEFPRVKDLEDILKDHFFTKKHYTERWVKFKKFLKQELKKPVTETMNAFYPCYSGSITIHTEKTPSYTLTKELHFYVSLLGEYYTILGIDKSEINLPEKGKSYTGIEEMREQTYAADHAITVSPYLEYADSFKSLQNKITTYFNGFRFVPFDISLQKIQGISLVYPDTNEYWRGSVFSALFRPMNSTTEVRGDDRFGFDEWLKIKRLDQNRIEEIRKDLLTRSSVNNSEITVHKIWKVKSVVPLRINSNGGNLSFGMGPIIVIDLTDLNTGYFYSEEDKEPGSYKYSVINNEIHLANQQELIFKVFNLEKHTLTLTMNIELKRPDKNLSKVDVAQMMCEIYS